MNLSDEIRKQIEMNKGLKLAVGEINNNLSILENLVRKDIMEQVDEAYRKEYADGREVGIKDGMCEAWEVARKIIRMSDGDILDLFPDCYASVCTAVQAILKYDAFEAIAKLKAYEEKQKADDKIEVGDEVNWLGDCFIVTRIFQPRNGKEQCDGIDDDGCVYHDVLIKDLEKTGRHFDIQNILEAMKHD